MYSALIVDDDHWVAKDIRAVLQLEKHGFDRIEEMNSAEEALSRILAGDVYDMIITDIRMGDMSGLDLIRACRNHHYDAILILVSAYSDFSYVSEAFQQEVFDYLLKPVSQEKAQRMMMRVCSKLEERHDSEMQTSDEKPREAFEVALEYIRKNYTQAITLEETADACYLSKGYLCALLKKNLGMSFSQFKNYLRIAESKKLIQDGNANMAEVAEAVGYLDANYFSRIFKRVVGMTPQEYQRMLKK